MKVQRSASLSPRGFGVDLSGDSADDSEAVEPEARGLGSLGADDFVDDFGCLWLF